MSFDNSGSGGVPAHARVFVWLWIFLQTAAFMAISQELAAGNEDAAVILEFDDDNGHETIIKNTDTDNNDHEEIIMDISIDNDDPEEFTLIVRQKAVSALSPSSRVIKASEFHGKFADLPSVLETVSGVGVRSMGGHGQYAESSIRGGAARGLRIYLDGVLLNAASAGAVDLSKIPLDRVQEIRVTKSVSALRQMGAGMGGAIELFTDAGESNGAGIIGANVEAGSFGYYKGGAIVKKTANPKIKHQMNFDASKSDNNYPFTHDNHTVMPTERDPDPTWDDTLFYKKNNRYRSVDGAYSLTVDFSDKHRVTRQISGGAFDQGLFVYHYKDDQSGLTDGRNFTYSVDYRGEASERLTIGGEASGIYRHAGLSDPDGHYSLGGAGKELESEGGSADFLFDARYALFENIYLTGLAGARYERHVQRNKALDGRPTTARREYRAGAEAGITAKAAEAALRVVYKREIDTSSAGLGYELTPSSGKKYTLGYPLAEAVIRLNLYPATVQLSAAASKRSPTFFERFGWGGGFLPNPDLKEETRGEFDAGVSLDMGAYGGALTFFCGRVNDKIKSVPRGSGFVKVMNFADTEFYGAEFDISSRLSRMLLIELSASWLRSAVAGAADPSWIGKREPFISELSGFLKTELDVWKLNIGHGVKYEGECYLNVVNNEIKPAQWELSAWAGIKAAEFLTLRYRAGNYLNTAVFDFLDNPKPRRTHVVTAVFNF